jgi:transcriptional regulator with XRE-family HTH domain
MTSLPSIDLNIAERLKADAEFRQAYFLAESSGMIARQLIRLRKRRGLSQTDTAKKLDTRQPAISRVESADYRNWSFNTLRRLAEAMDARLRVIIEPSEDILGEYEVSADVEKKAETSETSGTSQFQQLLTPAPSRQHLVPKSLVRAILEIQPSAATVVTDLNQPTPSVLSAGPLERQKPVPKLNNQISELTGAACN